jgi:L-alanine-DL-glutamate epimerase-like enolase superfamily enzyme
VKITDIIVNRVRPPQEQNARALTGNPSRLLLQIHTDEGITGISEGGGSGNLAVTRAYIEELIKPILVGKDPTRPRKIWELLTLGNGQQATRFPSQIVGSIDVALWDISGKSANLPIYQLLGGAKRTDIPLYWSRGNGWSKSPEEMLEEIQEGYDKGYRAFKVRMDWRDYRQDSDPKKDLAIFQKCREWLPDDCPLSFDANCGYSVPTAIEQGRRFEQLGIAHFEEPLPQYDFPGLKQVVDALDCAVSTGEQEISAWRFRDLIALGNPDILQPDVLNVGGLSEMIRVYEMAVVHNKIVMPHSPSVGANSMASLHLYSTVTNAVRPHEFSEEFTGPAENVSKLYKEPILPKDGVISLPSRPGLGLEIDPKALKSFILE